ALKYDDSLDAFGVHGVGGFLGALLTGAFASYVLWNNASGNSPPTELGKLATDFASGRGAQLGVQLLAALVAAGDAFALSAVLVKVIDSAWTFRLGREAENDGLDVTQHGEVGFDLTGGVPEEVPELRLPEPRAASIPPDGKQRFTVVVEGPDQAELIRAWSEL